MSRQWQGQGPTADEFINELIRLGGGVVWSRCDILGAKVVRSKNLRQDVLETHPSTKID